MECYYFGTFNPVHSGHIKTALDVIQRFGFERVVFVPSFMPPHKKNVTNPIHRFNMLKLIENDKIKVSDVEFKLQTPSYSWRTVKYLKQGEEKLNFIIGYDAFKEIESWKNPDFLKDNLHFIVLKRNGSKREDIEKLKTKGFDFTICDNIEKIDISSSGIRKKIQANEPVDKMLDEKVKGYIYEHGLYRTNFEK